MFVECYALDVFFSFFFSVLLCKLVLWKNDMFDSRVVVKLFVAVGCI